MKGYSVISEREMMHGYRRHTADGQTVDVVRCESGRWTVFVCRRGCWRSVADGVSFSSAVKAANGVGS